MDHAPRRNPGRLVLVVLLVVSLLGNALTIGALLRLDQIRRDLMGPAADSGHYPLQLARQLQGALIEHDQTLRPLFHAVATARAQVVAAAQSKPFDRAVTEAEMAELRLAVDALLRGIQSVVLDELERQNQE